MNNTNWFHEARYGMFIHWGAYSVAARGEWVANRERISLDEYKRLYAENFRAENYDPEAWAALAKEAGMGYAVLTARQVSPRLKIDAMFCAWKTRLGKLLENLLSRSLGHTWRRFQGTPPILWGSL